MHRAGFGAALGGEAARKLAQRHHARPDAAAAASADASLAPLERVPDAEHDQTRR